MRRLFVTFRLVDEDDLRAARTLGWVLHTVEERSRVGKQRWNWVLRSPAEARRMHSAVRFIAL